MNKFAIIKHIASYDKVEYYSVCLEEDKDTSLFELFIQKHTIENKSKLDHILQWIKVIGEKYGAKDFFFRNEAETADTTALPPKGTHREPTYVEFNEETETYENTQNNLRLYCFRANEHVVFLFNGDIKTTQKAQNCKNVKKHFKMANILTSVIDKSFGEGISWNEDTTDIIVEDDFELTW